MINASLARSRPISGLASLWHSTVGKKYVMAVSGIIWFGYLIAHLWGNLKIYAGPTYLNEYGGFLRAVGEPLFGESQLLWVARIVLIPALLLHIWSAVQLKTRDRASRPQGYAMYKPLESTIFSRTMIWGGIFILLFIIWHVLDLTFGTVHPGYLAETVNPATGQAQYHIYENVKGSFSNPLNALFYVLAMIAVGMHLFHGIWSAWQTLGLNTARSSRLVRNIATFFALLLTAGNISIPVAVLAGLVK